MSEIIPRSASRIRPTELWNRRRLRWIPAGVLPELNDGEAYWYPVSQFVSRSRIERKLGFAVDHPVAQARQRLRHAAHSLLDLSWALIGYQKIAQAAQPIDGSPESWAEPAKKTYPEQVEIMCDVAEGIVNLVHSGDVAEVFDDGGRNFLQTVPAAMLRVCDWVNRAPADLWSEGQQWLEERRLLCAGLQDAGMTLWKARVDPGMVVTVVEPDRPSWRDGVLSFRGWSKRLRHADLRSRVLGALEANGWQPTSVASIAAGLEGYDRADAPAKIRQFAKDFNRKIRDASGCSPGFQLRVIADHVHWNRAGG